MADASTPDIPDAAPARIPASTEPRSRRHRLLGNPVARTLLSIWAWIVLVTVIILWTPMVFVVWLVTLPFDRGHYAAGYLFRKRRPYVVVANHQSFVDILLISHLPWEMKWLSKQHFFRFPLVGWMMRMAGDIRLVRGERDSVIQAMAACKDRLEKKTSVMIFPEGTRTRDGELKAFKDGAFRLAIENQVPILPLAVNGAYAAMVKGDWRFGVSDAEVRVLEPIDTEGLTLDDLADLRERTHQAIADAVHDMRGMPRTKDIT
jgi:1-acyl-sn-glycerol-3-phosphate acyltransferase